MEDHPHLSLIAIDLATSEIVCAVINSDFYTSMRKKPLREILYTPNKFQAEAIDNMLALIEESYDRYDLSVKLGSITKPFYMIGIDFAACK